MIYKEYQHWGVAYTIKQVDTLFMGLFDYKNVKLATSWYRESYDAESATKDMISAIFTYENNR